MGEAESDLTGEAGIRIVPGFRESAGSCELSFRFQKGDTGAEADIGGKNRSIP